MSGTGVVVALTTTTLNTVLFLGLGIYCTHLRGVYAAQGLQNATYYDTIVITVMFGASAAWAGMALLAAAEVLRVERVADDGVADAESSTAEAV